METMGSNQHFHYVKMTQKYLKENQDWVDQKLCQSELIWLSKVRF